MTSLLLDTHAFVWAVGHPGRLSKIAGTALRSPTNELHVSAATAWEIAIKFRLGKLPEAEALLTQFEATTRQLGATLMPIDSSHAILAGTMAWEHHDPFDRMLAAQALQENLTFVTRDKAFSRLRGLKLLW